MSRVTGISWCDSTFNPWWGCAKISPACKNCFALRDASRWGLAALWGPERGRRHFGDAHWHEPVAWDRKAARDGRRQRVFCGSMCDWLELNASDGHVSLDRHRLFALIERTMNLDWLLLTKRPENLILAPWVLPESYWPRNAWFGVTIENQERADALMPGILKTTQRAPILFVSAEPLLGPLLLDDGILRWYSCTEAGKYDIDSGCCETYAITGNRHFLGVDWLICGGESGPDARPMHPDWVRSLRDNAKAAGIPFFFKQWGEWLPESQLLLGVEGTYPPIQVAPLTPATPVHQWWDGTRSYRVGRKAAGDLLDGVQWREFPMPRPREG